MLQKICRAVLSSKKSSLIYLKNKKNCNLHSRHTRAQPFISVIDADIQRERITTLGQTRRRSMERWCIRQNDWGNFKVHHRDREGDGDNCCLCENYSSADEFAGQQVSSKQPLLIKTNVPSIYRNCIAGFDGTMRKFLHRTKVISDTTCYFTYLKSVVCATKSVKTRGLHHGQPRHAIT